MLVLHRFCIFVIFCASFFLSTFGSEDLTKTPLDDEILKKKNSLSSDFNHHNFAPKSLPSWVHSVGQIVGYFDDGTLSQGYALLLENGYFITSSNLVKKENLYPTKIELKMQDDSAKVLICIANLEIRAINDFQGIALLSTKSYTDSYCKPMQKSFYQARIYDLFYVDLFGGVKVLKQGQKDQNVFFPEIKKSFSFEISEIKDVKNIFYKDEDTNQDIPFGYFSNALDLKHRIKLGTPFFDAEGKFMGIFAKTARYNYPIILNEFEIKSFLCNIKTDVRLGLWRESDCLGFQQNVIKNIQNIIQKNDQTSDESSQILEKP